MDQDNVILCVASKYEEKYYLNEDFENLPSSIQRELQIMCVLFTEEIGGILTLEFDKAGNLNFITAANEGDLLYDDIGSALKIKQICWRHWKPTIRCSFWENHWMQKIWSKRRGNIC